MIIFRKLFFPVFSGCFEKNSLWNLCNSEIIASFKKKFLKLIRISTSGMFDIYNAGDMKILTALGQGLSHSSKNRFKHELCVCLQRSYWILNPFVATSPFLYPLKKSEGLTVFWCFQVVEKRWSGSKWVNSFFSSQLKWLIHYMKFPLIQFVLSCLSLPFHSFNSCFLYLLL